ncbi:MAG: YeeE/YedE family protein [Synergistaceae bacterium]|nr:YeeE/YedE family protein [Synergistaceae bacterium]
MERIHLPLPDPAKKPAALILGILFGFLLQKGGVTRYETIIGQLLLLDFTVLKVMLSAVLTGMLGIQILLRFNLVALHPKHGSFGSSVIGGLIFGLGFGLLGYCPGTAAGAAGQGSLDALFGGVGGMLLGAAFYSEIYHRIEPSVLRWGNFGDITLPELLRTSRWKVVTAVAALLAAVLAALSLAGL